MEIKETKEALLFAISLGNALGKSVADDGKIGLSDLAKFLDPAMKLPAAFSGAQSIAAELSDLDDNEKAELVQAVSDTFDIPDDKVEDAIEEGLKLAVAVYTYINKVVKSS